MSSRNGARLVLVGCVVSLLGPGSMGGQGTGIRAGEQWVVEERLSDRWYAARQGERFAPVRELRRYVYLTPTAPRIPGGLSFQARFHITAQTQPLLFDVGPDGRFGGATITRAPIVTPWNEPLRTEAESIAVVARVYRGEFALGSIGAQFTMPESRVWEIVPVVPATTLAVGTRWVDTVDLRAEYRGNAQLLAGVRRNEIVGDSTVAGTRHWIVSSVMDAAVTERTFEGEASFGAHAVIERRAAGTIRGRWLYDAALRLRRGAADTTTLAGEQTLRLPDGRVVRSAVRYERRRVITLHTPAEYDARVRGLWPKPEVRIDEATQSRVSAPEFSLRGAPDSVQMAALDSLHRLWSGTRDPFEAARTWTLIRNLAGTLSSVPASIMSGLAQPERLAVERLALAAGDTTGWLASWIGRTAEWTPERLRDVMLPAWSDPSAALALGISRHDFYGVAVAALVRFPPAITPPADRPLSDALLDQLASLDSAADPRLRELALVTRFVRDPRRLADTVLSVPNPSPIVREAVLLARGAGSRWATQGRIALPERGTPAPVWREWVGIPTTRPFSPVPALLTGTSTASTRQLAVEPNHTVAIRFYEFRTGRPVVAELREALAAATDGESRAVFTAILQGIGELGVEPTEVIAALRSGDAARVAQARASVDNMFRRGASDPMDDSTRIAIFDRAIAIALQSAPSWRDVAANPSTPTTPPAVEPSRGRVNSVFISDSVPAAVITKWSGASVTFLTSAEWSRISATDGRRSYRVSVRRAGAFLDVSIGWSELLPSSSGLSGHGGSTRILLVQVNGEWMAVSFSRGAS